MRNYEVITDGSDLAERFCADVLRKAANYLNGEPLHETDVATVNVSREWLHEDGVIATAGFAALKSYDAERAAAYNIWCALQRPIDEQDYWPTSSSADDSESDDDEVSAVLNEGGFKFVKEVLDYYVDEHGFTVQKDLRWEYYYSNSELAGMVRVDDQDAPEEMLSEIPEEDIDLQTLDASFANSFSEKEVSEIKGILARLGFVQ